MILALFFFFQQICKLAKTATSNSSLVKDSSFYQIVTDSKNSVNCKEEDV